MLRDLKGKYYDFWGIYEIIQKLMEEHEQEQQPEQQEPEEDKKPHLYLVK